MSFLTARRATPSDEARSADAVLAAYMRSMGMGSDRSVAQNVTPDTAMGSSAVAAAVLKIANLSMLEPHTNRNVDGRLLRAATDAPILREPSADLDALAWRRQVYTAWLTRGTAFGMVARVDAHLLPLQIELIPAEHVTVRQVNRSALPSWEWKVDGQVVKTTRDGGPLWVAPGLHQRTGHPVGISPIEMALGAIRLGLLAEDFGTSWFLDGGQPSGVLETPQVIDDPTAASMGARFADKLRASRRPVVLGSGLTYKQISVAANESQFIDTLDRNVATVARFFGLAAEDIGGTSGGNGMTYSNIDAAQTQKLLDVYQPWITHFEAAMTRITARPQTVRCDLSGLIRADITTRTAVDRSDVLVGIRLRDEIRHDRGLDPLPDGAGAVVPPFKPEPEPTQAVRNERPDA